MTAIFLSENYPNKNICFVYVRNLIRTRFHTESVNNKKRESSNRGARDEAMQLAILVKGKFTFTAFG